MPALGVSMNLDRTPPPDPYQFLPAVAEFSVTSADFTDGAPLDMAQVHDSAGGGNRSPSLSWRGFPTATQSFAVTCFDPDAPTAAGWWHWQAINIPVSVAELPTGAGTADNAGMPGGTVQMRTDFGTHGYQGCAPPQGDYPHRYFFVVHALDVPALDLGPQTSNAVVGFHLVAHGLARATIVGTFRH